MFTKRNERIRRITDSAEQPEARVQHTRLSNDEFFRRHNIRVGKA